MTTRRRLQALALLGLGLLILYGLLLTVHLDKVAAAIRGASLSWIGLGMLSSIGFILLRSWRWHIILTASNGQASLANATAVTSVGFAVNSVSPFKLGELLRIAAIAQRTRIGIGEAGATVVLERILDVLALLVLALGAAVVSGGSTRGGGAWGGLLGLSAISLAAGVVAWLMAANREQTLRIIARASSVLPARLHDPVLELSGSVLRGLSLLDSPARIAATGILSLAVWIVPILGLVAYFRSVTGALALSTLFLAMTLFVITQAVSVTPASVGTYEGLFVIVLSAFGAGPPSLLTAAAVVSHAGGTAILLTAGALGALWLRVNRPPLPVGLERPVPG